MTNLVVYAMLLVMLTAMLYCIKNISFAWMFLCYASAILIGGFIGFYYVLAQGKPFVTNPKPPKYGILLKMLTERAMQESPPAKKQLTVISRNIDAGVEEVMDLIVADYILYYLKDVTSEHDKIRELIKDDMWIMVKNIKDVLGKIDEVKFISNDVTNKLCQHYQKIRISSQGDSREQKPIFYLRPYLQSPETEMEFLRKVSEALLVLWLPPSYSHCEPVRHLLREIFTCSVLYPTIEMLSDPDYINQKLLSFILYQQEMMGQRKKTYAFAATFEDFFKMISESTDINQLKQMRYKIMSEILQSTTMGNLKKAKGMAADKEFNPQTGHKGDLLQARNLNRYINQLTIAKTRCEQKIKSLGGPDYSSPSSPAEECLEELSPNIPGRTVLSFQVIMESLHARQYFMKFLQDENLHSFLGFWEEVELIKQANQELIKQTDKKNLYHDGNKIYTTYITNTASKLKFEKNILKGMEAFLKGDKGPEAFFSAQEAVSQQLEERHYHRFIVSDWYHKMLKDADDQGIDFLTASCEQVEENDDSSADTLTEGGSVGNILLADHSSFARDKLQHLEEKLTNKMQALIAIRGSHSADLKVISKLQKEIDFMKQEKNCLEYHIRRTEAWGENFGRWTVRIVNAEILHEKDKQFPAFHLYVYQKGNEYLEDEKDITNWKVVKKLHEFIEWHQKLIQIGPWLKYSELPKEGKTLFKNYDKIYLEKAKHLLQTYLNLVMDDDKLNRSECLYMFLSPSPEFFILSQSSPRKNKSFLTNIFKGNPNSGQFDGSDEDEFLFWDDDAGPFRDDPIAEPLFTLICEIFDMKGLFKLLRRNLIRFVKNAYGKTINRQLRETISWVVSEPMIIYYIHLFRDAMWPGGVLAKPAPVRSDDEKRQTQRKARHLFLNKIPEILNNLIGQDNARQGALKVFESLQDVRLNKQLLYEMFELFLNEVFLTKINENNTKTM